MIEVIDGRARWSVTRGRAENELTKLPSDSVDAVVCDPPYELGFMGKTWDSSGIAYSRDLWAAVLRVLKPGGHGLAFGGTRTFHRMVCAIEDAGAEIRDCVLWLYGQGFPKSLNIAKAFDKANGVQPIGEKPPSLGMATGPNADQWNALNRQLIMPPPTTAEAKKWDGWGTALKPSVEPVTLFRKPFNGTVTQNIARYGVGGLNIAGCELEGGRWPANTVFAHLPTCTPIGSCEVRSDAAMEKAGGTIFAGSPERAVYGYQVRGEYGGFATEVVPVYACVRGCPVRTLEEQHDGASRFFYVAKPTAKEKDAGCDQLPARTPDELTGRKAGSAGLVMQHTDGSAKANPFAGTSGATPRRNTAPTVKPVELMRQLVRLVVPGGGVVLDPFAGSGSTGVAALKEGLRAILIDRDEGKDGKPLGYCEIARARCAHVDPRGVQVIPASSAEASISL